MQNAVSDSFRSYQHQWLNGAAFCHHQERTSSIHIETLSHFLKPFFIMRPLSAVITNVSSTRFDSTATGYVSWSSCYKLIYASIPVYQKTRKI
jgi:hypothetical protein